MNIETITMQLIVNSGNAKSAAMKAIASAKAGDMQGARTKLEESDKLLTSAHKFQTDIIQEEAEGNIQSITILMAHAQDHLMNAITVVDLAREFVDLYEKLYEKE